MNESLVTVIGNMIADPVLRNGKNGRPFATFRVASTIRRRDPASGTYVNGGTNYVNVVVFNALAANVVASLKKGEPVIVYGRLRVNEWVGSQNQHMTSVEVEGYNVGHDLTWGQAKYTKMGRVRLVTDDRPDRSDQGAGAESGQGNGAGLGDRRGSSTHPDRITADQGDAAADSRAEEPRAPSRAAFERSVADAETDPYDVVTSG